MPIKYESGDLIMPDYKTMYQLLCVAADRAITELEEQNSCFRALETLKSALLQAEDIYIETLETETPPIL